MFVYPYVIIATTLLFLLYIQFSDGMGNIWYRNGEYFSPMGAVHIIAYPLHCIQMWYPDMWDINYLVWIITTTILYYVFQTLSNLKYRKRRFHFQEPIPISICMPV